MKAADRRAAVKKVQRILLPLWNEHMADCKLDVACPAVPLHTDALEALDALRKG